MRDDRILTLAVGAASVPVSQWCFGVGVVAAPGELDLDRVALALSRHLEDEAGIRLSPAEDPAHQRLFLIVPYDDKIEPVRQALATLCERNGKATTRAAAPLDRLE